MEQIQVLFSILCSQCDAGAFKRFSVAVAWPGPAQLFAPGSQRCSVNDWGGFFQPMRASDIHSVRIAVPDHLDSRKRMIPTEVHAADARPLCREFTMVNGNAPFGNRKD